MIKVENFIGLNSHQFPTVSLRCPTCRNMGTFEPAGQDLTTESNIILGHRRCPNKRCYTHVFFALSSKGQLITYPAERIDFDTTKIPGEIVATMEEAITCHASGCYVAAAIMVRKTLEELCHNLGVSGKTLNDRISALSTKVILPQDLLTGITHLRLLGNDAAHIESQTYNQIGKDEVGLAIDICKELLKSTYQLADLVNRLASLQRRNAAV